MKRFLLCAIALTFACGKEQAARPAAPPAVDLEIGDPGAALAVKAAKEKGPGEEVVVVGRVQEIVKGFAAFRLIDASLKYCGEVPGSMTDDTPWDYCCETPETRTEMMLVVEVRGPDGRVRAGTMPSLRLLDLVAVKGKLERDDHGNLTVVALGWHRRERPNLPSGLRWP